MTHFVITIDDGFAKATATRPYPDSAAARRHALRSALLITADELSSSSLDTVVHCYVEDADSGKVLVGQLVIKSTWVPAC